MPSERLYGKQTRLSLDNTNVSGKRLADMPVFLAAYAHVKAAAAYANRDLGALHSEIANAIVHAAQEVSAGQHNDQFPTSLVQGGGGTSTNMNLNEVLASRATALLAGSGDRQLLVHPNDHVNRSQSTNDTYPTAMRLALHNSAQVAIAELDRLVTTLHALGTQYVGVSRLGRTCLQDAITLTIEDTHKAQASGVERVRADLAASLRTLQVVPLGATVLGSGLGTPHGYQAAAIAYLSELTGLDLVSPDNLYDALANADGYVMVAHALGRIMIVVGKLASDLRLLASGPHGGIGELSLPALQAGSSMMPGKVNPIIPELVMQLGYRVRGAVHTVELAASAGEFEVNVMGPVILDGLMNCITDVTEATRALTDKCLTGAVWNIDVVSDHAARSLESLVAVAAENGYDVAAGRMRT